MKLNTVNIIEIANGDVQNLTAFPDNPEGNNLAEELFVLLVREHEQGIQGSGNGPKYSVEDIETFIEDGSYHDEYGYYLVIVHST